MNNSTKPGSNIATHSHKEDFAGVGCLLLIRDEFEREGLRGLLANRGMKSFSSISHFESAVETVSRLQPNVIIAVAGDPPDCPVELLAPIRKIAPDSGIIVLCDPISVRTYLPIVMSIGDFGPAGVKLLLRAMLRNGDRMATTIDQVLTGRQSVERDVIDLLVQDQFNRPKSLVTLFTKREFQVFELVSFGATNANIARKCDIALASVGNLLTSIFVKLGFQGDPDINRRVLTSRAYFLEYGSGDVEQSTAIPSEDVDNAV